MIDVASELVQLQEESEKLQKELEERDEQRDRQREYFEQMQEKHKVAEVRGYGINDGVKMNDCRGCAKNWQRKSSRSALCTTRRRRNWKRSRERRRLQADRERRLNRGWYCFSKQRQSCTDCRLLTGNSDGLSSAVSSKTDHLPRLL